MNYEGMMMSIAERLKCIADMVEPCAAIADIGTDHAYIPIYLINNNICSHVIATDIRDGPLKRAKQNIIQSGLQDYISIRKGEGLCIINPYEVDYAIIAGMGGYLICDILAEGKEVTETIKKFVIQPMQSADVVRRFLYENNYRIYDEKLVKENEKIFQIMAVEHGIDEIDDDIYFEIGKLLIKKRDPVLLEFLWDRIYENKIKIDKIADNDSEGARLNRDKYRKKLTKYQEVLKCIQDAEI